MKKILIISYSFPPLNLISSRRAEAYAKYFARFGYQPTVISELREPVEGAKPNTWKWHPKNTPVKKEQFETFTAYFIPRVNTFQQRAINFLLSIPAIKILTRMVLVSTGHPHGIYYHCYQRFGKFLRQHLREHEYDCILASYKPDFPLKLAHEMRKEFGTPFVGDYRDFWDNRIANPAQNFTLKERFINSRALKLHKQWIRSSLFFVMVTRGWCRKLLELTGSDKGYTITNGFEQEVFENNTTEVSKEFFFITYTGNVYLENDFGYFYKAFRNLISSLNDQERQKIKVRFFTHPSYDLHEQRTSIGEEFVETPGWIPKEEVVNRLKESAILFTLGFTNQPGTIPGKVFEYLGARRNVLVTPSDDDEVHSIIRETGCGLSSSDVDEVTRFLKEKFKEWKEGGQPKYNGDAFRINQYSRENQVKEVARLLDEHLNEPKATNDS